VISRNDALNRLETALDENPVAALLGPRQCGKTTLARGLAERRGGHWFDLESAEDRMALAQPELTLRKLSGLVVIDEIQRAPEIFTTLRPLADRRETPARFLILGSASPEIVRGVSESLAGRVGLWTWVDSTSVRSRSMGSTRCGCEEGFPARSSRPRNPPVADGVPISSGPFSNVISHSSASAPPRRP